MCPGGRRGVRLNSLVEEMGGSRRGLCRSRRHPQCRGVHGIGDIHGAALAMLGHGAFFNNCDQLYHVFVACGGNTDSVPCDGLDGVKG